MASTDRAWSLRRRLLVQLVLAIGLLLGGLFVLLDVWFNRTMLAQLDQFLATRAATLARQVEGEPDPMRRVLPAWDIAGHGELVALHDRAGRLRAVAGHDADGWQAPARGGGDLRLPDGHAGRYLVVPLRRGAFAGGWLTVATERESWDRREQGLHLVLVVAAVATITAAVLLCLLLVRRAFVHLEREAARLGGDGPLQQGTLAATPRELRPFVDATHAALHTSWALAARERRFSRNVAHELRTPVAEIAALAGSAAASDPTAWRRALQDIGETNARMQRGIEALLALARFESGQEPPQDDPVDLAGLLRSTLTVAPDHERIDARLPGEAWAVCDAGMLERITSNLLHNALEYGDPSAPVQVALQRQGDGWWLEVGNHARGLREADLAHFGERHWRGSGQGDAEHAGLGLALAQAMATALGLSLTFALDAGLLRARVGPVRALPAD